MSLIDAWLFLHLYTLKPYVSSIICKLCVFCRTCSNSFKTFCFKDYLCLQIMSWAAVWTGSFLLTIPFIPVGPKIIQVSSTFPTKDLSSHPLWGHNCPPLHAHFWFQPLTPMPPSWSQASGGSGERECWPFQLFVCLSVWDEREVDTEHD